MKKANVEKLEIMAAGFLQYRYRIYLITEAMYKNDDINKNEHIKNPDLVYYEGACNMIESFGGHWQRHYKGDNTADSMNDITNYSHNVWFPNDEVCSRLNEHAWD